VVVHVASLATASQFVDAMNPATERFLAGGQWFQLWQGEIITMDSPEADAA
jgi:CO/xanthine dehydrogenase FAD-binding subunit